MARAGQFHYGKHAINDDSGSCASYPKTVEERLTALDRRLWAWARECPLCGKKPADPPYDPSWKVNELLDLISMWIQIEITTPEPRSWRYFISSHAMRRAKALKDGTVSL
jgi:hypothetical protein